MTRREFSKLSIFSFLLGGGVIMSNATPRRSLLAAKRIANLPRNAWRNPYVTDGLIAMWDGEWNAGGGVHDAAATVWKDLANSFDLSRFGAGGGQWGDRYYDFTDAATCFYNNNNLQHGLGAGAWTVACVFESASGNNVNYHGVFGGHQNTTTGYMNACGICGLQYENGVWKAGVYSRASPIIDKRISVTPSTKITSIVIENDGVDELHFIINDNSPTSLPWNPIPLTDDTFMLGNAFDRYRSGRFFNGRIYHARIYSRVLNADETAANQAVDKERFGLP